MLQSLGCSAHATLLCLAQTFLTCSGRIQVHAHSFIPSRSRLTYHIPSATVSHLHIST